MINSPNNPTGWTLDRASQAAILGHCRRQGIWIIADDVYERLYYATAGEPGSRAPSFLDLATPDDRVVSTNSFSKAWSMTGWRLGWIVAPAPLMRDLGTLIEYNTSCSPGVRAARAASPRSRRANRPSRARWRAIAMPATSCARARAPARESTRHRPRARCTCSSGSAELTDSLEFCKRLVREAKLGLAPGSAFGPEGEGFVRWCFAAGEERLADGVARLARFLERG